MSDNQTCPNETELSDLIDGNLIDPQLSELAGHLETCIGCQERIDRLSSRGGLVEALRGEAKAIDKIASQTPQFLVDRIKQIPALDISTSGASNREKNLNGVGMETHVFSTDSTTESMGTLGAYRILKLLGSGGMGSVFLAEDTRLSRQVALKVMLPKIAADPIAKQRFLREARSAASLKSDHIVTVYEVDEDSDVPFLAMEFLEGRSLDEAIKSGESMTIEDIVHIAKGVAKGLADAHEKGLVHRDVKPGNIWLERNGEELARVKILDFGLARMELDDSHLTHASAIVGTPAFMAPEQARGEKSMDSRSDLFSLGCVIYYLCTREVPFKADSTLGTLMALAVKTPDSPSVRNPKVPLRLSRLTMRLLEKDPNLRLQSAREVVAELRNLSTELENGSAEYNQPNTNELQSSRANSISHFRAAIFLALSVGLIAGVVWYLTPRFSNPNTAINNSDLDAPLPALEPKDPLTYKGNEQLIQFFDAFKAANPAFDGDATPTFEDGELVELVIKGMHISNLEAFESLRSLRALIIAGEVNMPVTYLNLSPLNGLPLKKLGLQKLYLVSDLDALRGMKLEELYLDYSPVTHLKPLEGMQLQVLYLWSWHGSDLEPLRGMPLKRVNLGGNGKPMDLSPLAGAPLNFFCANLSQVSDISPLQGMPLRFLYINQTQVSDLSPVRDAPIEELMIRGTRVTDISVVKDWPLRWIEWENEFPDGIDVLKQISTLERINDQNAARYIDEVVKDPDLLHRADFVSSSGMKFALVPKGKTTRARGNFDEVFQNRDIEIQNDFYLGLFEVTQHEWQQVMGSNPSWFSRHGGGSDTVKSMTDVQLKRMPVEKVSWIDCQRFLDKLNELEKDTEWIYRLPTEAEWTYACQGGPMTDELDAEDAFFFNQPSKVLQPRQANCGMSRLGRPCRVGMYDPNRLGIFDMHGNVWEWCDDLAIVPDKRARWIHGGGWRDDPSRCKSSFLLEPTEPWTANDLGFRVARVRK